MRLFLELLEDRCQPSILTVGTQLFPTIQSAVNAAVTGDTVDVPAGVYREWVRVRTPGISIVGVHAGVFAWQPLPSMTIVQGPNGQSAFSVLASDDTLDGIAMRGATSPNQLGGAMFIAPGVSGTHVTDCTFAWNVLGMFAANSLASDQLIVSGCYFHDNDEPGPASGTGSYADNFSAGEVLNGVSFTNDRFIGSAQGYSFALGFSNVGNDEWENISITGCYVSGGSDGVYFFQCSNVTLSYDTFTNLSDVAIAVYGGCHHVTVNQCTASYCYSAFLAEEDLTDDAGNVLLNSNLLIENTNLNNDTTPIQTDVPVTATNDYFAASGSNAGPVLIDPESISWIYHLKRR